MAAVKPVIKKLVSPGLYQSNLPQTYGNALLIVDPQLDFHPDDGKRKYEGSLGVPGANEDSVRIKNMILENLDYIDEVYVTMDTHMMYHIAHPIYWKNRNGEHPKPFTTITKKDVQDGVWQTTEEATSKWGLEYVTLLEKQGRFQLTIWPEHCKLGTRGHTVNEAILEALDKWERIRKRSTSYIIKGNNSDTEHYSALKAEVEIKTSEDTKLNRNLLTELKKHNKVYICGQALSHCVNYTTRDLVDNWDKNRLSNIFILEDASSPVKGFEDAGAIFLKEMTNKGVQVCTTKAAATELRQK